MNLNKQKHWNLARFNHFLMAYPIHIDLLFLSVFFLFYGVRLQVKGSIKVCISVPVVFVCVLANSAIDIWHFILGFHCLPKNVLPPGT